MPKIQFLIRFKDLIKRTTSLLRASKKLATDAEMKLEEFTLLPQPAGGVYGSPRGLVK